MRKIIVIFLFHILSCFNSELISQNTYCNKLSAIDVKTLVGPKEEYIENNLVLIDASKRKAEKALLKKYEYLKTALENNTVIKNNIVETELNTILNTIILANPKLLNKKFTMLYAKEYTANAASLGNNIFFVYAGLFEILENDEQLTFVLCHEIAHQILNHFHHSVEEGIRIGNSEMSTQGVLDFYRENRLLELNADALGFELYSNLNYPKAEAIKALQLLKTSDSTLFSKSLDVKSQLNFGAYPFKQFWIKKKENLFKLKEYKSDFRPIDSLRTHPNIDQRIKAITEIVSYPKENQTSTSNLHITKIKNWQKNNYLCVIRNDNRYDLSLYFALEKYYKNPNDIFAAETIANSLYQIYLAKKKKQFSKFIPPPNPFSTHQTFEELILFLKNTEAREIRKVGLAFCNSISNKSEKHIKIHNEFIILNK